MRSLTAASLLVSLSLAPAASAQLIHAWTAPAIDDGNPITPEPTTRWLTDVESGQIANLPNTFGGNALAADNSRGLLYSSSGDSLGTAAIDENGGVTALGQPVRIRNAAGVQALSGQVESMGFANGVVYASVNRSLGDERRRRGIEKGLYAIDLVTAQATLLRTSSQLPIFPGMDYNPEDGQMYAVTGTTPQEIVRFDLTTFAVVTVATVPASAYNGVTVRFQGLAVGDGKVFLTHALNSLYGNVDIAVFDIASGSFEEGLPTPARSAENREYAGGATFVPSLAAALGRAPAVDASDNAASEAVSTDLVSFFNAFAAAQPEADINRDGRQSLADVAEFLKVYTPATK